VCVQADGSVDNVRATAACHDPEIDGRVLDAASRWRFAPATLSNHPVPTCTRVTLRL
jgi:TonB family protein